MDIVIVAYDGVRLMDVTAPLEVFSTASRLGGSYRLTLCSPGGGAVTTSAGTRLLTDAALADVRAAHTVVVPGSPDLPVRPVPGLVEGVTALADVSRRVASVCTGAFALAEAGLLDGRRATTHWRHAEALARRHPAVAVEPDAIYVRDGRLMTSAGVTAGIDLALAMVEQDEGPGLAREVARDLVVFLQRPGGQSQFSVASRTPRPRHDVLRAVLDGIAADPAADHSLPAMAGRAGVSVRHLTRLFRDGVDTTPAAHVEALRVEAAQALLESGETVTGAARRSGLGSDESLRRAFLRHLGVTPSAYRARFRSTVAGVP
ncbi:GlxA family transcriptional regulator [Thermomonospora umbrina]|uniref:AraC family transcriptional regulator with amidase-like domain n=1 Tax=Thermomonospora umbrina TaxID=111806 RepID=A0A3D9SUV1_9ACTN|nr:DJ-1/PfpI family protein [Thermomonospora umbrina]REE95451.1 AraC family transcriptional regulator with amidase-like domain [Thermomonospora umbrina]